MHFPHVCTVWLWILNEICRSCSLILAHDVYKVTCYGPDLWEESERVRFQLPRNIQRIAAARNYKIIVKCYNVLTDCFLLTRILQRFPCMTSKCLINTDITALLDLFPIVVLSKLHYIYDRLCLGSIEFTPHISLQSRCFLPAESASSPCKRGQPFTTAANLLQKGNDIHIKICLLIFIKIFGPCLNGDVY